MVYTIEEITNILKPILTNYDVKKAAIFGSYARGQATDKSDVDLLITTNNVFDLEQYYNFENDLESALRLNVDIMFYHYINPYMLEDIKREMVIIFEK
ncbi:MAG: nucleotidyltransferase domain-containing protein [Clostridiales bacterium]|jgi:predicted nucleotidyltransferase|nr:nucleotidyltransferase domain-containing protein [Clostridiales bacterium]